MVSLEENKIKQGISEGCLMAIAAKAGISLEQPNQRDDYGVDFHVKKLININGATIDGGGVFDIQLKCTTNYSISNERISYPLRVRTHNLMIQRNIEGNIPVILALMLLPQDGQNWCNICFENIIFQNSILWYENTDTTISSQTPDSTRTIHIPKTQILTPDTLWAFLNKYDVKRVAR